VWLCVCVCVRAALVIKRAKRICRIILSSACLTPSNVSILSKKRHDFLGNVLNIKVCFDLLYNIYLNIFHFKNYTLATAHIP
jgi:hypothetical protein